MTTPWVWGNLQRNWSIEKWTLTLSIFRLETRRGWIVKELNELEPFMSFSRKSLRLTILLQNGLATIFMLQISKFHETFADIKKLRKIVHASSQCNQTRKGQELIYFGKKMCENLSHLKFEIVLCNFYERKIERLMTANSLLFQWTIVKIVISFLFIFFFSLWNQVRHVGDHDYYQEHNCWLKVQISLILTWLLAL